MSMSVIPAPDRKADAPASGNGRALDWLDGAFVAVVLLFASDAFIFLGINSIVWLLCYAYMLLRLVMSMSQIMHFVERDWVFLAYPVLAISSMLWSDLPIEALRFSLQLLMTVLIAIFIGARFRAPTIFRLFFGVTLFAMVASVLNVTSAITPAYDGRGLFQGIFLSKNVLGHRTVLFVVTCVFGLFLLPHLRPLFRMACALGLGAALAALALSGSATGVLFSGAAAMLGVVLWLLLCWRGAWSFLAALLFGAIGLFLIAGLFAQIDPLSSLLGLVGRDATLTGRTILWEFGWQHYLDRPWLGFGAKGFWSNPEFAPQILVLQQYYGEGVSGFHNLIVELLVMLGPLGLLAHLAMTATALHRTLWHARNDGNMYAAWAFVIIVSIFGMSLLGPQYYQGHSIVIMLVVILGTAFPIPSHHRAASAAPLVRKPPNRPELQDTP